MSVAAADIQAIPAFAARTEAEINFWLVRAPQHLDVDALGDDADAATIYWVAHALSVTGSAAAGGLGGAMTGRTVGPVSVQYAQAAASGALGDYTQSAWGGLLRALLRNTANSLDLIG